VQAVTPGARNRCFNLEIGIRLERIYFRQHRQAICPAPFLGAPRMTASELNNPFSDRANVLVTQIFKPLDNPIGEFLALGRRQGAHCHRHPPPWNGSARGKPDGGVVRRRGATPARAFVHWLVPVTRNRFLARDLALVTAAGLAAAGLKSLVATNFLYFLYFLYFSKFRESLSSW